MSYPVKYSASFVRERIAQTVSELRATGVINDRVVFLVMLNGGVWFALHAFDCIPEMPNEVYMLKGHSYSGKQRGTFYWDYFPDLNLKEREVLVLDDICDSGATVNTLYHFLQPKAAKVSFFTLLKRSFAVVEDGIELYTCIEDDSHDFFVGCGLDDNGLYRMLPYVGVVK